MEYILTGLGGATLTGGITKLTPTPMPTFYKIKINGIKSLIKGGIISVIYIFKDYEEFNYKTNKLKLKKLK
jgi:hypothetical protein